MSQRRKRTRAHGRKKAGSADTKPKVNQLGEAGRKCDAKLRVIANGDSQVNVVRSERCDALSVAASYRMEEGTSMESVEAAEAARLKSGEPRGRRATRARPPARGSIKAITPHIYANVFISKHDARPLSKSLHVKETARLGDMSTAKVPLSKIKRLAADPLVRHVALGQGLRDPSPVVSTGRPSHPEAKLRAVEHADLHDYGKGVLVGIIDVQGFDFAHPDFLLHGKTRFEAIWDMGARPDGTSPKDYGRVIRREDMNRALAANVGAPATQLEPQSQMDFGS